jgi:hypothetical protein
MTIYADPRYVEPEYTANGWVQTLFVVTYPAGAGTPSNAQIVAGQQYSGAAASWAGNAAWTGSGQYLEATGLDAATEYDSAAVIYDGTTYSNVVEVSGTWTTLSSAHLVTASNSASSITASSAAIAQSHHVTASDSSSTITASTGAIGQTHQVQATNSVSATTTSSASIGQTHRITAASSTSSISASKGLISTDATHFVGAANSTSSVTASSAAIGQTHAIAALSSTLPSTASSGAIAQIHLVGAANSTSSVSASAGAISIPGVGVTLSPEDIAAIAAAVWGHATALDFADKMLICSAILRNKTVTDSVTGIMTVYADDGTTPYLTAQLHEDVAQTQTYRGQGAEVRGRLQ